MYGTTVGFPQVVYVYLFYRQSFLIIVLLKQITIKF